jgi:TusA-related sulfurtransferase
MENGWVKIWRSSLESHVFTHDGMWKLWCLCLMKANHKEAVISISGRLKPVKIFPGQFITGRFSLHSDYHQLHLKKRKPKKIPLPCPETLFKWLLSMAEMQMLHIKTTNKYTVITINNWNKYQNRHNGVGTELERSSTNKKKEEDIKKGGRNKKGKAKPQPVISKQETGNQAPQVIDYKKTIKDLKKRAATAGTRR